MKIKRIIAAVMAVCVIGGAGSPFIREKAGSNSFIAYAAEEEEYKYVEVDDIGYVVYSDHAEVNMFDVRTEGAVVIPEKVEGVPVTVVIGNSMSSPYKATSIKLPDTIETIGDCAFNHCDGLTSVNIPAKLKHIGARAFNGCSGIKEFKLPDTVETIGDYAFENCAGITEMTVPAKVKELGVRAFANCENLEKLTFKGNDTVIAKELCAKDSKLADITFAEGIWDFRQYALTDTKWMADQRAKNEADNNSLVIVNNTLVDAQKSGGNADIPDNVKYIGEYAFHGADNVSYINIPDSVEVIGNGGIAYCSAKEINLGKGLKTVGKDAFRACVNVKEINIPNSVTSIGEGCIYGCEGMESVHIPDSTTELPDDIFSGCKSLKEFTISEKITKIGSGAFWSCYSLPEMIVPETVKEIGACAFGECRGIKKAVIKAPIESLPNGILKNTYSLESVELPSTLKKIEPDAFMGTNLKLIDIPEGVEEIDSWSFSHANFRYIVMPKSLKVLGDYAFYNDNKLERVKFLNQATEMVGNPLWCDVVGYEKSNAQAYSEERENVKFILIGSDDDKNYKPNLSDGTDTETTTAAETTVSTTTTTATGTRHFCDANGDGMIDARDATVILTYYAKASSGYTGTIDDYIASLSE